MEGVVITRNRSPKRLLCAPGGSKCRLISEVTATVASGLSSGPVIRKLLLFPFTFKIALDWMTNWSHSL